MTSRCECGVACGPRVSGVGSMLQTSALWVCRAERETGREIFKHEGRGRGEKQEERCTKRQHAWLPQMMMVIRIVPFQKQTRLGSIYLEEGTYLGDTRQETQHEDIDTVLKRHFFCPALPFPIPPCAPHLPPLFCQSWSLALSLLSAIARAPLS